MALSPQDDHPSHITNALTVDVEDYFQVSAFEPYVDSNTWDDLPIRVERNTQRILALLDKHGVHATFFVLGWVAERFPALVRSIVDSGHELASHGYSHVRVIHQTPAQFREDITRTRALLEDISGVAVQGYRAASYSIGKDNLWALDHLHQAGYRYDSSIFPGKHDLYGMPGAPRTPYFHTVTESNTDQPGQILEIPITTLKLAGRLFHCAGGGFFRLYPYPLTRWALKRLNRKESMPVVFYCHPWEIDPEQPRLFKVNAKTRFRHYLNLNKTHNRLDRLLNDFSWDRMDRVFLPKVAA
ncbi:MAG: DUF3473 domain-containing protein [Magnetococcales bacterium]|nr:DUF3473 domain-containing protein [Magnetococcales bacterium]